MVAMVHPRSGEIRMCQAEGMGLVPAIAAKKAVWNCVEQLEALGYKKAEELTPEERARLRPIGSKADLAKDREQIRPGDTMPQVKKLAGEPEGVASSGRWTVWVYSGKKPTEYYVLYFKDGVLTTAELADTRDLPSSSFGKGITQQQVLNALGEPSRVNFDGDTQVWTYISKGKLYLFNFEKGVLTEYNAFPFR